MTRRLWRAKSDGLSQDLSCMDVALGRMLQPLLLGRFDTDILQRWAKARGWVSAAQEGDWLVDLSVMDLGVRYLAFVVGDLGTNQ